MAFILRRVGAAGPNFWGACVAFDGEGEKSAPKVPSPSVMRPRAPAELRPLLSGWGMGKALGPWSVSSSSDVCPHRADVSERGLPGWQPKPERSSGLIL